MHLIKGAFREKIRFWAVVSGLLAVVVAILVTPAFTAAYLSRDHQLTSEGIRQLNSYRLILSFAGVFFILWGSVLKTMQNIGEKMQPVNAYFSRLVESKILKWVLLLFILCFMLLRFINLNADFPSGITTSSEIYTDEGWYTTAAVRHFLTEHWYQAGEVNTAVPAPVTHILHRVSFALLGLSWSSARTTVAVSFVLLTVVTALLVRRSFGDYAALLTALLMAVNYLGFAYSRLATPYLIATNLFMIGLFVAGGLTGRSSLLRIVVAASLVGLSVLTHGTALLAVPLLIYLAWHGGSSLKERLLFLTVSVLVLVILVGGSRVITSIFFPRDYVLYNATTLGRMFKTFSDWAWNFLYKMPARVSQIGSAFVILTMLFTILAALVSRRFRTEPLVHLLLGYIVVDLTLLCLNSFGPPRYYLSLIVPFSGLCAISCITLVNWLHEKKFSVAAIVPLMLVAVVALKDSAQIISYISRPVFSFYQMTHAVENIIQEREGAARGVGLFGDIADSISLEIGTNAANSLLIMSDLEAKVKSDRPKYMIVHVSEIDEIAASEGALVTQLGAWDVFGNYYANGEQVRLYLVEWPEGSSK